MEDIRINDKKIGKDHPVYVIAEIGLNHQGDIELAKKLIDAAAEAEVDCVKFQKRSLKKLYKEDVLIKPELQEQSINYLLSHIKKAELTEDEMRELHRYSLAKGLDFTCTPWEEESLRFLSSLDLPVYKVGSPDMFNLPLIKEIIQLDKPFFISTGMSFVSEIETLIDFLNNHNARYVLLHCNSTYPASYYDINLNFLSKLMEKSKYAVGYSGHERGFAVVLGAISMGARVIEKHLSLDRNMPGPDHKASLEPEEFKEMVKQIRILEKSLGEPVRYVSRGEFLTRESLSKSLVIKRDIKKGEILQREDIGLQSPGKGTSPLKLEHFIGRKTILRDLKAGDDLLESDVDYYNSPTLEGLDIKHHWGMVVRMGDVDGILEKNPQANYPNFVEVHFTDSDIKNSVSTGKEYPLDVTFHGPEYNDDLLMDLSNQDPFVRQQSIDFFNQAFAYARKLKPLFRNKNDKIKFVVHPGGMDMHRPLLDSIEELNNNLLDSLKKLDSEGFELLVENMPPFPWYFGGQWHHSSFMAAEEILEFSQRTGYKITLDISHAALYCNYYHKDLTKYVETILPAVGYVHIADAAGLNGEGLKIGDGTVNFKEILELLVKKDLWFLPEVWQGHKFGGEDFVSTVRNLKMINQDF